MGQDAGRARSSYRGVTWLSPRWSVAVARVCEPADGGHTVVMDVFKLARGLAMNRMSFGVGLVLVPGLYARTWVGSDAAGEDSTRILARALGARDLVLGAGGLLALRDGDAERSRRWFAAQGVTDAVDLGAALAARGIPMPARMFVAVMAGGSAAIAGAYVRYLTRELQQPVAERLG
jgi:hypothetical protein